MAKQGRTWFFIAGLLMNGFGFWASTFAGSFLEDAAQLAIGLYLFGLILIMGYVTISAITYAKLEKRVSALEGDPEEPKR